MRSIWLLVPAFRCIRDSVLNDFNNLALISFTRAHARAGLGGLIPWMARHAGPVFRSGLISKPVIPAQAGIHTSAVREAEKWVPDGVYPPAARGADPGAGTTIKFHRLVEQT